MYRLEGSIRSYAWGSRRALAQLSGRPAPTAEPEAELWYGAHPGATCHLADPATGKRLEQSLEQLIAADPQQQLGDCGATQLPFLLKFLAARQALSIQAHPSKQQAEEGYARENAAGIALDSPQRSYKDANHKPELLIAFTPFSALAGLRPLEQIVEILDAVLATRMEHEVYTPLAYGILVDLRGRLAMGGEDALRDVFTRFIKFPYQDPEIAECMVGVVETAVSRLVRAAESPNPTRTQQALAQHVAAQHVIDAARTAQQLAQEYPGDIGVVISLMLNTVHLQPGEALFLEAGQLHAYLKGVGVELMASSDNVLRGGLTEKHIDVPELLAVGSFTSLPDALCPTWELSPGVREFCAPVDDFHMMQLEAGSQAQVQVSGPAIVLAGQDGVQVGEYELRSAQAMWIPAVDREVPVRLLSQSDATVSPNAGGAYIATVGGLH